MPHRGRVTASPPMEFDGALWWYLEWFDPAADLCCRCRQPIAEDEVPLILFKTRGKQTLQTRVHVKPCGADILRALGEARRDRMVER